MDQLEYRILTWFGLGISAIGGMTLYLDVLLPGVFVLITGMLMTLAGVVGAWWNDDTF